MELNLEVVPAPPRAAASVVMVRDTAQGLEVFLIRRHDRSDVLAGAHVFPGGKIDPHDRSHDSRALLARERVVHLRSLPRTPQHNAWVERANGELKLETGLGKGTVLASSEAAGEALSAAGARLADRPRPCLGGRTSRWMNSPRGSPCACSRSA